MAERAEADGEAWLGEWVCAGWRWRRGRGSDLSPSVPTTPPPPRSQNEAVQALRRAQLQYVQRSEDLWVRSQASPEDPAPQASPGPSKQQERRRRSREEAQAKVGTWCHAPQHFGAPSPTLFPTCVLALVSLGSGGRGAISGLCP